MEGNSYQPPEGIENKQQADNSGSKLFSLPHKYLAMLVAVLCLVALGSAALLLSEHYRKDTDLIGLFRENLLRFSSPTPTPQQMLEDIEETLGWNVYSNSQYGYSIKYPLDWEASRSAQEDPKILEYVIFKPFSATRSGELPITLTYSTRSYKEVLDADPQPGETVIVASVSGTRKLKEDSQRRVSISVALPYGLNSTLVLLAKEEHKDIFNKMLSTLKLTGQ